MFVPKLQWKQREHEVFPFIYYFQRSFLVFEDEYLKTSLVGCTFSEYLPCFCICYGRACSSDIDRDKIALATNKDMSNSTDDATCLLDSFDCSRDAAAAAVLSETWVLLQQYIYHTHTHRLTVIDQALLPSTICLLSLAAHTLAHCSYMVSSVARTDIAWFFALAGRRRVTYTYSYTHTLWHAKDLTTVLSYHS